MKKTLPSNIINEKEEYKVKEIQNHRKHRQHTILSLLEEIWK